MRTKIAIDLAHFRVSEVKVFCFAVKEDVMKTEQQVREIVSKVCAVSNQRTTGSQLVWGANPSPVGQVFEFRGAVQVVIGSRPDVPRGTGLTKRVGGTLVEKMEDTHRQFFVQINCPDSEVETLAAKLRAALAE